MPASHRSRQFPRNSFFQPDGKPGEQGLRGEYFDNQTFSGKPRLIRIDGQVHFTWAMGSPDSLIPREHFSVRWTGTLMPKTSGTYRFGASTDDGVRLWLDGKLLIDSWFDRGATLDAVTVKLEAGRGYDLRIDYYENDGWSYASLVWQQMLTSDPRIDAAADAAGAPTSLWSPWALSKGKGMIAHIWSCRAIRNN